MKQLSDQELLSRLIQLAHNERAMLGEVLRLLREMEVRKIYVTMGFPSLYEFAQNELGYSEWEAHVRIQAMRLIRNVPEVKAHLEDGQISLTVVTKAQTCFRREEKKKTPVAATRQKEIINSLCGRTKREAERILADLFPGAPSVEKVQMLKDGMVRVEFVVNEELWKKIQVLFSIRSHTNPEKRWDKLICDMVKLAWKKWHPAPNAPEWAPHQQTRH